MGLFSGWLLRPLQPLRDPQRGDMGCLSHPGHGRDQSLSRCRAEQATLM